MEENCRKEPMTSRHKHDIVSSLPLELVAQVAEYLDAVDIVRSQMVSKRWNIIFSSNVIIRIVLPRTLAALGLETANVTVADAMIYIQWLHGLESARPIKKVFLPWPDQAMWLQRLVYDSRRLCWLNSHSVSGDVTMLDLETGKRTVFVNDAGECLINVTLSNRYLVMVSAARRGCIMVVWDTHTSQRLAERQFPGRPPYVAVVKDKVVIVPDFTLLDQTINIWDLHTNQVQTIGSFFNIELLALWHVDVDEGVLVTFEIDWNKHSSEVEQKKWSLSSGKQLDRKSFSLSVGTSHHRVDWKFFRWSFNNWCCTRGYKTSAELFYSTKDPYVALYLMYDYAVDRLSLSWIDCTKPINDFVPMDRCNSLTPHIIYRWSVQLRGVVVYNVTSGTATVHPYQLHAREVITRNMLGAGLPPPPCILSVAEILRFSKHKSFGDREVFGLATYDGIQLWFFNPAFVPDLPDAEPFLAMEESG